MPDDAGILTIPDVIDRMGAISEGLAVGDGVRAFNDMYLETTRQVGRAVVDLHFADSAFLDRLDVRFAQLYFQALNAHEEGRGDAPRCWAALFDVRAAPDVARLQFALAGMNAHISYDLPQALVTTVEEFGVDLEQPTVREDYLTVNDVLARTQPIVKDVLLTGPLAELDDAMGEVDDHLGMWAIEGAREMAWRSAQALWALRDSWARERYVQGMDRMVELSSRLLLRL
ncbi:MAG: DUF5995 family protein [Actinomycetota bacterium]|nr:DUF5995 family protein [Actinomycetota bacterium]MDH4015789.1 DUF5995 family protein [Actinomycetota bacterium]